MHDGALTASSPIEDKENPVNRSAGYLLTLALAASAASIAHARSAATFPSDEDRLRPEWQSFDKNRDGVVSISEVPPMMAVTMGRTENGDGVVTLAEYVAYNLDPGGSSQIPLADNVRLISDVPYAATGNPRHRVDIYLPKKPTVAGPLPVIAYVHGGGWAVGSKLMGRPQMMQLVNSGRYVAVSIGHRLIWEAPWPAQIHDVKAGIRWIRGNGQKYGFDAGRICAVGTSAGGHLVAVLAVTGGDPALEGNVGGYLDQSSKVKCVVDQIGPIDLRSTSAGLAALKQNVESLLGGDPAARPQVAAQATPLTHVDPSDPPFMIIHGTKDPLVGYQESVDFDKALRAAGVPVVFQTIEGGGHGDFGKASAEVARRTAAFLERNLYDPAVQVPSDTLHH